MTDCYTTGAVSGSFDNDCAQSGDLDYDQSNWLQTTVPGPGTVTFLWKAPGSTGNPLEFRTDGTLRYSVSDQDTWQQRTYTITGTGTHTLRWTYSRGSDSDNGCGYVDYVQWTGPLSQDPPADAWRELTYVYDASGRRIEKKYNNVTVLKYIYDGDSCIAEYDASSNLRRKYIYGPGIDQPVCMIEATVSPAATYYYHFDALGSVVTLTNSSGNTVEVYDYSVYGQVGASDATHPNRFMFTGREFDKETGLYYYRARYYNPQIGRFLQTDPIGYGDGMNLYRYCRNNPLGGLDPSGTCSIRGLPDWLFKQLSPAWQEALTLFSQWANGEGPDEWDLGLGNAIVDALIGTPPIEEAMQLFRDTNRGRPWWEWEAVTYHRDFGPKEMLEAGTNAALQFLGSFDVEIIPRTTEDGSETIVVKNTVSWSSYWRWLKYFGLPVPEVWERSEGCMFGNMRTRMTWTAKLLPPVPCPVHGTDTCCVCGYCPCYCNYRWTGGYCTVLKRWPGGHT